MDKLIMLGTGHAMTTQCFNTCFVYESEHGKMLVDTGGGQQLVGQLRSAGVNADEIDSVFLSHRHTDHLLGLPWLVRMRMKNPPSNPLTIYAHDELCQDAEQLLCILLPELRKKIGSSILFSAVQNGDEQMICGRKLHFYDTMSKHCKQFGFAMTLECGGTFVFNGDVPFHEANRTVMQNARYLMHEAFALTAQMQHNPGGHSSVAQTGRYASELGAQNLIIIHGSDQDLSNRRKHYIQEASIHFKGPIFVPCDLETIELNP